MGCACSARQLRIGAGICPDLNGRIEGGPRARVQLSARLNVNRGTESYAGTGRQLGVYFRSSGTLGDEVREKPAAHGAGLIEAKQ